MADNDWAARAAAGAPFRATYAPADYAPGARRSELRQDSPTAASAQTPSPAYPRSPQDDDLDADYLAWRDQQLEAYDRDYRSWRQAQAERHDAEYRAWRAGQER